MPGACGLRPRARIHRKKALCHTCPLGGASNKYHRRISVLSEQYKTSYRFYVTLSFLCYIICNLLSVFTFSLVTLFWGHNIHNTQISRTGVSPSNAVYYYIQVSTFQRVSPFAYSKPSEQEHKKNWDRKVLQYLKVWLFVCLFGWLFRWLVRFYGISKFVGYSMQNSFLCK